VARAIEVAKLIVPLVADTSQFESEMAKASASAQAFGSDTEQIVDALNRGFKSLISQSDGIVNAMIDINDSVLQVVDGVEDLGDEASDGMDSAASATDDFAESQKRTISVTTSLGEKIKTALVQGGVNLLIDASKKAVSGALQLGKSFAKLATDAAPLQAIGAIFDANAERFGVSLQALQKGAQGTISNFELMKQANVALTGAGQQLGEEFGKKLPALLEASRAAARATGQDAQFLFESLVSGVKRASPMLIDNTGIVLKVGEANEALAKELGKTVEQLTAQEKSIAILNATVEAGAKISEQFGSTQLTVAEQLQKTNAIMQNFRDTAGVSLQPVLSNLLGRFNDLAMRVLPPLATLFENRIAPALDVVVDKLGGLAETAINAGEDFSARFGGQLMTAAENALRWGINISVQLATGLVKGASQAIVAAMQFIGGLLKSWLGPGSPPRVYPDIDKDGALAFDNYLKGFGDAEFGILEGLQAPLQDALSTLVDAGAIGEKAARSTFKNLSVEIAAAADNLMKTGKVGTVIFEKLEAAGGEFGDELSDLARKQFALASATREVLIAEENLASVRKANEEAQTQVDKLADEFNELLAAGADPAILDAKRAEFLAAEEQLALSEEQVAAAEEQKAAAEEQVDPLANQLQLQQKVLDQLLAMSDAQEKLTEATSKMPKPGDMPALELEPPVIPAPDFSIMTQAFATNKETMQAKFAGLFAPITEAWENDIKPTLATLGAEWTKFTGIVSAFWQEKVVPVIDEIKKFIPPDLIEKFGKWGGIVLVVASALGVLSLAVSALTSPFVLLAAGIALIITFGEAALEMFMSLAEQWLTIASFVATTFIGIFFKLWEVMKNKVLDIFTKTRDFVRDKLGPIFDWFRLNIIVPVKTAFDAINEVVKKIIDKFATLFDKLEEAKDALPSWMRPGSPTPLEIGLRGIGDAMADLANFQLPALTTSLEMLPVSAEGVAAGNGTTEEKIVMNVYTQATTGTVIQDIETARALYA
jgi:hypothetical protein